MLEFFLSHPLKAITLKQKILCKIWSQSEIINPCHRAVGISNANYMYFFGAFNINFYDFYARINLFMKSKTATFDCYMLISGVLISFRHFYKKLGIYCERTEPYVTFEVLSIVCPLIFQSYIVDRCPALQQWCFTSVNFNHNLLVAPTFVKRRNLIWKPDTNHIYSDIKEPYVHNSIEAVVILTILEVRFTNCLT